MKHHPILFLLFLSLSSLAQKKPDFNYGLDFHNYLDNREFDIGGNDYINSMTIFGSRLTPEVYIDFREKITPARKFAGEYNPSHRLVLGVDIFRDFGKATEPEGYFKDILLYYEFSKRLSGKTGFSMTAGMFPREKSLGLYSEAFFSDSLKFYDPNLEGLMFRFTRPEASFEIACDWLGKYGAGCRERFMILSCGSGRFTDALSWGYAAMMYHFASSEEVHGVVDNILVNPYIKYDFSKSTAFSSLSLSLGYLQAAQCDRKNIGTYVFPGGAELVADARLYSFGLQNRAFYGKDMMPYYNCADNICIKYGNNLYRGDPFYRVRTSESATPALCDRLEAFWEPQISRIVSLRFAARFYFNEGYEGSNQIISVKFAL